MNPHEPNVDDPVGMLLQTPLPADEKPTTSHVAWVKELVSQRAIPVRPVRVRWRREILSVAAIVLAVAGIVFWPKPHDLNVVADTKAPDWSHAIITETGPFGEQIEMWICPSLKIQASKSGDMFLFHDSANQVQYFKNTNSTTIYRAELTPADEKAMIESFKNWEQRTIYPSKIEADIRPYVQERIETVKIDDKEWIERTTIYGSGNGSYVETALVDPTLGRVVRATYKGGNTRWWPIYTYDYPPVGPGGLDAFGIPKDAKIVDGMPPASAKWNTALIQLVREVLGQFK